MDENSMKPLAYANRIKQCNGCNLFSCSAGIFENKLYEFQYFTGVEQLVEEIDFFYNGAYVFANNWHDAHKFLVMGLAKKLGMELGVDINEEIGLLKKMVRKDLISSNPWPLNFEILGGGSFEAGFVLSRHIKFGEDFDKYLLRH